LRLTGPEGRHAVAVRRLRAGEAVEVVDGCGRRARGTVSGAVPPGELRVAVTRVELEPPPTPRITVVQALLKGDALPTAVEMMTEVGVDEFVPWAAERSVARWAGPKVDKGLEKLRTTCASAGKQARRAWFPEVARLATLEEVVGRCAAAAQALVLHEAATGRLAKIEPRGSGEILLVVGPEGGISDRELAALREAGAEPVRMGATVLRGATAGTAASAVVMAGCGRWR